MAECIHGLEAGRCDICNPKPRPLVESAPPKATRPRATPRKSAAATKATLRVPAINVGAQRIYHVTHMSNLAGILESGCLLADAKEPHPVVDISSPGNREERRAAAVDTETVAQYVPFFVTPDSVVWEGIRSGVVDPRLSADARHHAPAEFVMLVSTVDQAGRDNAVIAAGDAADPATRFIQPDETMGRELHRLHQDEDALRQAEFLVWDSFPFESVTLIGVANDKARDDVRAILATVPHAPKVSVYPPWFARP